MCITISASLVFAFISGYFVFEWPVDSVGWCSAIILISAILGGGIGYLATEFSPTCSFVGTEGAAHYSCDAARKLVTKWVFMFEQSPHCQHFVIKNYDQLGMYCGSKYKFTFLDPKGEVLYNYEGTYNREFGLPAIEDPFCWVLAIFAAWQQYQNRKSSLRFLSVAAILNAIVNQSSTPPESANSAAGTSGSFRLTVTATTKGATGNTMVACDLHKGRPRDGDKFRIPRTGKLGTIGSSITRNDTLSDLGSAGNQIVAIGDASRSAAKVTLEVLGIDVSDLQKGDQLVST